MNFREAKAFCIMNPAAGTRRQVRRIVEQMFLEADVAFDFYETQAAGHAFDLAKHAVEQNAGCVIGIGGDGTLNEVARALVGTEIPLGMIPVGSGNAFARALGISTKPKNACVQLLEADIQRLDVGRVESDVFLSTSGIGLDAEVAWQYADRKGKRRGLLPYLMLTLSTALKHKPDPVRLILDGDQEVLCNPTIVVVANTPQYGNGVIIAPGAKANDGMLDVRIFEPKNKFSMAQHSWRLFSGSIDKMPGVRHFCARHVQIRRETSGYYQFDGEALLGKETLNFSVKPQALSVLVPKQRA